MIRETDDLKAALGPIPALAPIPRSERPADSAETEAPVAFLVTPAGDAPELIQLPPRLAAWLRKLAEATATAGGLKSEGDARLRKAMNELAEAGVPVVTVAREPRSDGGAGQCALYRLAGEVEAAPPTQHPSTPNPDTETFE